MGGQISAAYGNFGKPYQAVLSLDDNGGGRGWFFDPTPTDSSEFPQVVNASHAIGDIGGRADFYSAALREIGNAIGLAIEPSGNEFAFLANEGNASFPFDPRYGTQYILYDLNFADPRTGTPVSTYFTNAGEQGLYPGPLTPALNPSYDPHQVFPNDLMTGDPTGNTRDLISDVDVALLAKYYFYSKPLTLSRPTDLGMTVLTSLNPATGLLTISGDPTVAANTINLTADGSTLTAIVDGITRQYPRSAVGSIAVVAAGDDTISVPSALGTTISVYGPGKGTLTLNAPSQYAIGIDAGMVGTGLGGGPTTSHIYYSGLARVELHATSSDLVNVFATPKGTTLALFNPGRLAVGASGTVDAIQGPVDIQGAVAALSINDSLSKVGHAATLSLGGLYYLAPANITFGLANLQTFYLYGPMAGSTFFINETPQNPAGTLTTDIFGGAGNDIFQVANSSGLDIDAGRGANWIVAPPSRLSGYFHAQSSGGTYDLFADDRANTVSNFATMSLLPGGSVGSILVGGRAALLYNVSNLTSLTYSLGNVASGTPLSVQDTAASARSTFATTINLGGLNDLVGVIKASGPLTINGRGGAGYQVQLGMQSQAIAAFKGLVAVNFAGIDALDQKAAAGEAIGVGADKLTINGSTAFTYSNPTRLRFTGANRSDTYNLDVAPGGDLIVSGGTAADTFNIAPMARSIDGFASVGVSGGGGVDRLTIDDSKAKAPATYNVVEGPFFGSPSAIIQRSGVSILGLGFTSAGFSGSGFGSTYQVSSALNGVPLTVVAGAGDDRFLMGKVVDGAPLTLAGGGGANTLDYTSTPSTGTVAIASASLPNPVALYKADGNAKDSAGIHDGSYYGNVTLGPGYGGTGGAFQFVNTGSRVEVPDAAVLNPTAAITLAAWVNLDTYTFGGSDGFGDILGKVNGYKLKIGVDGTIQANMPGTFASYLNATAKLPLNAWTFVATTYDSNSGDFRIYVNGALSGETITSRPIAIVNAPLEIGGSASPNGSASGYQLRSAISGRVDNASLYNVALTAAQITAIFNGSDSSQPPVVAKGVTVDLTKGKATGVAGGVSHIQNLFGSPYADILIGDGGPVFGLGGGDLLFAGPLSTRLSGDDGDDLLIAGTTTLDPASLDSVLAQWSDSRSDVATRLAKLRAGLLGPVNVASNGKGQSLLGGAGVDAFLDAPGDTTDAQSGEPVTNL